MYWDLEDEWTFPERSDWCPSTISNEMESYCWSEPDDRKEEYEVSRQIIDASALLLRPSVWWKSTNIPKGKAVTWKTWPSKMNWRYFLDRGWILIGSWASVRSMQTVQSFIDIDCRTDLTVSILNGCLMYRFSEKDLLPDVTFRSFLGTEITGNKNREFPDFEPFPLSVSGDVPPCPRNNEEEDWLRLIGTEKEGELTWKVSWNRLSR